MDKTKRVIIDVPGLRESFAWDYEQFVEDKEVPLEDWEYVSFRYVRTNKYYIALIGERGYTEDGDIRCWCNRLIEKPDLPMFSN